MSDFVSIPGHPGYFINARGQVKSEFGLISPDEKERYRLRNKETGKQTSISCAKLLALAGFAENAIQSEATTESEASKPELPVADVPDSKNEELEALRKTMAQAILERDKAKDALAAITAQLKDAERINKSNRTLNATLWARLRQLEADLNKPQMTKAQKRSRMKTEQFSWEAEGEGFLEELDF